MNYHTSKHIGIDKDKIIKISLRSIIWLRLLPNNDCHYSRNSMKHI